MCKHYTSYLHRGYILQSLQQPSNKKLINKQLISVTVFHEAIHYFYSSIKSFFHDSCIIWYLGLFLAKLSSMRLEITITAMMPNNVAPIQQSGRRSLTVMPTLVLWKWYRYGSGGTLWPIILSYSKLALVFNNTKDGSSQSLTVTSV